MTVDYGASLRASLNAMEARGRSYLAACARRDAAANATLSAASAAVVAPLLFVIIGFFRPVPTALISAGAIGLPLLVAGVVMAQHRRKSAVGRLDALTLYDRGPGLKDRIVMTDEFLSAARVDGFRAAAVAEAAPWLARSVDTPLAPPPVLPAVGAAVRRRGPVVAAATLLLVLALCWRAGPPIVSAPAPIGAGDPAAVGANGPTAQGAPPGITVHASVMATLRERLGFIGAPRDGRRGELQAGRDSTRAGGASAAAQGEAAVGGTGEPTRTAAADAAAAGKSGAAGRGGSADGAGGAGAGQESREIAAQGKAAAGDKPAASAAKPDGRDPASGNAAATSGGAAAQPPSPRSGNGARSEAKGSQGSASAPGAANPPERPRPPGTSQQPGSPPPSGSSASKPGQQGNGSRSGNNKNGNGKGPPGSAQDATKRSRGLMSLLLAVPTVDRLVGTPDDGPSRATTRRVPPQQRDAAIVAAGARGRQNGDAGVVVHRLATQHESRLVETYFDRSGDGAR